MRVEGQRMATEFTRLKQEQLSLDKENISGPTKSSEVEVNQHQPNEEEVITTTNVMNEVFKISNYHLQFRIHKESERIQVKLIDSETKEVIREIPPEKVLEYAARIKEMLDKMTGILLDETI